MTIAVFQPRGPRRLRLTFEADLLFPVLASAFTVASRAGVSVTVERVYAVPGDAKTCELALASDLDAVTVYDLTATGVPLDPSGTTSGAYSFGTNSAAVEVEAGHPKLEAIAFDVDLRWSDDFAETTDGDLDTIGGRENAIRALHRRAMAEGLPWDADYGARVAQYVDAPGGLARTMLADIGRQMTLDDRVSSVRTELDDTTPSEPEARIIPTLAGDTVPSAGFTVPIQGSG